MDPGDFDPGMILTSSRSSVRTLSCTLKQGSRRKALNTQTTSRNMRLNRHTQTTSRNMRLNRLVLFNSSPISKILVVLILTLTLSFHQVQGQFTCNQPGYNEIIPWRSQPMNRTVSWRLDQVCSGTIQCYGPTSQSAGGDQPLDAQLCPVQLQAGDSLYLLHPPVGSPYTTTVVNVSESAFYSCPSRAYPPDQILQNSNLSQSLQIPQRFLTPGILYLAQHPDGAFSNCNYGLRIKILIKDQFCRQSPNAQLCSGRGVCGSKFLTETYRCYCYQDYRNAYCTEYDACASGPCQNGARCVDGDQGLLGTDFLCICAEGFTGPSCREILGQCAPGVCGNGSCVAVSQIAFRCNCRQGFTGTFCDKFTDMCTPNPCQNGATCVSRFMTYACLCQPGYTGGNCENNVDECASNPCASGATCVDDVNGFYCRCPPGFDSELCSDPINFCDSSSCENSATCIPVLNGFVCNCSLGFTGDRCEIIISRCSEAPGICQHGGHCLQSPGGPIQCQCSPGWTGLTCEKLDNLCRFNPCPNGTVCIDTSSELRPGTYLCSCPPGFTGSRCETQIQECSSNPCVNRGVCVDRLAGYHCICPQGYTGTNCEINIDMCEGRSSILCQNNATCVDGNVGLTYTCICKPGYASEDCSEDINECASFPCQYDSTCRDRVNGYSCLCQEGFSGQNCQIFFNYCSLQPCRNAARCIPTVGTYQCVCGPGWTGQNCTWDIDECNSSPCLNGATCQNLQNQFRCMCPPDYTGPRCETRIDDCTPTSCLNGGTCLDLVNSFRCFCAPGYTGRNCATEVSECLSTPCLNGGICQDRVNGYQCFCDVNLWAGTHCEIPLNNCSRNPCFNDVECRPISSTQFTCVCPPRYTGRLCETLVELCTDNSCLNGATCRENLVTLTYECLCPVGYYGERCENDRDFCIGNNCRNGATCQDGRTGYTCLCRPGFNGERCEENMDECASQPCQNGAICEDGVNRYQCFCVNGYTGADCSQERNECLSSPCLNGGACVDSFNQFTCFCVTGYAGTRCETNINDCVNHACRNGAQCVDGLNDYTCRCLPGYIGSDCSFEINECLSSPCDSAGSLLCTDRVAGYVCTCRVGYTGQRCESQVNECGSRPCRNGGTCTDLIGGYRCECKTGFTGTNCEWAIDDCASSPCGVGTCVRNVGRGYTCVCPADGRDYDAMCNPILPCTSNPCRNQATCVSEGQSYRCLCRYGFTGQNCAEADYCKISNVTCDNGGICANVKGNFSCVCTAGYEGRFCETNRDDCRNHFCTNGATCVDRVNGYNCLCLPGYVSQFCQNVATSCIEEPCYNGATCLSSPNFVEGTLFTCVCPTGFEGAYCHIESDECASNPCQNGGTCSQGQGVFSCACKPGYTGRTCHEDINECESHVCQNGATCVDQINGYTCLCPVGYTGSVCQSEILECASSPCQNGGQCVDGTRGYECFCRNGFTGIHCELDYDECLSSPCQNEATCVNSIARFECVCQPGVTGVLCENNIDECSSSPCRNGATCTDLFNGYNCTCPVGYLGVNCEIDIDECGSSPCRNGGTCRDREGMYVCDCVQPYRGVTCDMLPCDLNPCESGGTCFNDLSRLPDGFRCECILGLTGTRCQSNIDDCVRQDGSAVCSGRGLCLDDINKYICLCQPGWKGQDCEVPIDECTNNNCRNNATCVNLWQGYRCACVVGYEGQFCERQTDECEPNPCTNGATCVDLRNDYRCLCREGWTGKNCDTEVNECRLTGSNPCFNGGTCVDSFASYTCQCPAFYTGSRCETRYDPCDNDNYQCQQEAQCRTQTDGTYVCLCPQGFTGTNCELDVDECASSPCRNGGRCEDRAAGYRCYCAIGYTGTRCEINIDDCLYCQNGATCQDLVNGYICSCAEGYQGRNCTVDVNECDAVPSPCKNGASCTNTYGSYLCRCKAGYTGINCDTDVDECESSPCQNRALCQDGFGDFTCFCQLGYTGTLCEVDIDDCTPNPCRNGRCTDRVNSYRCTCDAGWAGLNCTININECASQPCVNGGSCVDGVNGFTCTCPQGFTGPRCELDVEVCQRGGVSQCLNGGTCNEGLGTIFTCICKPGYTGRFCETDIDECASSPCQNGGTCEDGINEFTCDCKSGWTSEDCSIDINECLSYPCINKGICQQKRAGFGYECLCRSGLGGVHCEINYDDCIPDPCVNGGTCVDGLNAFTCLCPSYATGKNCETLLVTPTPSIDPSTQSVSMSSTPVTQPSTGVVSTLDVAGSVYATIDGTSMLSGTVITSMVEDNLVSFVSTPMLSNTYILEPSQSVISVIKKTVSPMSSMTTTALPDPSEMDVLSTASVESSVDLGPSLASDFVLTPVVSVSSIDYTVAELPDATSVMTDISTDIILMPSESAIHASSTYANFASDSTVDLQPTAVTAASDDFDTINPSAIPSISDDIEQIMSSSVPETLFPMPSSLLYKTLSQFPLSDTPIAMSSETLDTNIAQSTSESEIAITESPAGSFTGSSISIEPSIVPTASGNDNTNVFLTSTFDLVISDTTNAMLDTSVSTNSETTDTLQSDSILPSKSEQSDSTQDVMLSTDISAIQSQFISSSSSVIASSSVMPNLSDVFSTESAIFPSTHLPGAYSSVLSEVDSEYLSTQFAQSIVDSTTSDVPIVETVRLGSSSSDEQTLLSDSQFMSTSFSPVEASSAEAITSQTIPVSSKLSIVPSSVYSDFIKSTLDKDSLTSLLHVGQETTILPSLPTEIVSSPMMTESPMDRSVVEETQSLETVSHELLVTSTSANSDVSQLTEGISNILQSSSLVNGEEISILPSDILVSSMMTEIPQETDIIDMSESFKTASDEMPISPSSVYSEYIQSVPKDISSDVSSSSVVNEDQTVSLSSKLSESTSSAIMTQTPGGTGAPDNSVPSIDVSEVTQTNFVPSFETILHSSIRPSLVSSEHTASTLMMSSLSDLEGSMLSTATLPSLLPEDMSLTLSIIPTDFLSVVTEVSERVSGMLSSEVQSTMHVSLSSHPSLTESLDVSAPPTIVTDSDIMNSNVVQSTVDVKSSMFEEVSETVLPVDTSSLESSDESLDIFPSSAHTAFFTGTVSPSEIISSSLFSSLVDVVTEDLATSTVTVDNSYLTELITPFSESVMLSTSIPSLTESLDGSAPSSIVTDSDLISRDVVQTTLDVTTSIFDEVTETVLLSDTPSLESSELLDIFPSSTPAVLVTETPSPSETSSSSLFNSLVDVVTEDLSTSSTVDMNNSHSPEIGTPFSESVMLSSSIPDSLLTPMFSTSSAIVPETVSLTSYDSGLATSLISEVDSSISPMQSDYSVEIEPSSIAIAEPSMLLSSSVEDSYMIESSIDSTLIKPSLTTEVFSSLEGITDTDFISEEPMTDSYLLTSFVSEMRSLSALPSSNTQGSSQSIFPSSSKDNIPSTEEPVSSDFPVMETEVFQTESMSLQLSSSMEPPFVTTMQSLPVSEISSLVDISPTATLILDPTDSLSSSGVETVTESELITELPSVTPAETSATEIPDMTSMVTEISEAATILPSESVDEATILPSEPAPDSTSFVMEVTKTIEPETGTLLPSTSSGDGVDTKTAIESTPVVDETLYPSDSSIDISESIDSMETTSPQSFMTDTLSPSLSSMLEVTDMSTEILQTKMSELFSTSQPSQSESILSPTIFPTEELTSSLETKLVLPESASSIAASEIPITSRQSLSPTATSTIVPEVSSTDVAPSVDPTEMPPTTIDSASTPTDSTPTESTATASTATGSTPTASTPTGSTPTGATPTDSTPTVSVSPSSEVTTATPVSTPSPMSCSDRPCYNNATCVDVTLSGGVEYYVCVCTTKYRGTRCREPRVYDPMRFSGMSLLTFFPIPLQSENTIRLTLRTNQPDGVIFYSARDYTLSDSTHYIRLLISDGMLVYQFSCKIQSFDLESNVRVNTGELFNVTISQSEECKAQLDVSWPGNTASVEVGMPFVFPSLYLTDLSTFYIGGVPSSISYVPAHAPNFTGCVSVIDINGRTYGFFEARDAYQVKECGSVLPTAPPDPPLVSTVPPSPLPTCDEVTCQNGASCRQVGTPGGQTTYRCDCPLHYVGRHCEQEIGISFPFFSGQSFLQHPNLEFSGRPSNDLYLTFKTSSRRGSLLYAEDPSGAFVHLLIEGGYLKYQASCGPTNVVFVDTRITVNYDNLTAVNVRQTTVVDSGCTVTLRVNDHVPTVVTLSLTPPQQPRMFGRGPLYLGGLPPGVTPVPRATLFTNYIGCIRHLQINGEERLVFQDAIMGQNIEECDVPLCEYRPCYNNATCLPSVEGYSCECLPGYTGALCERTACDRNPCEHGGTCIHQANVGNYVCICPQGRHGVNCEQALTITRAAYFGTELGYISFTAYPPLAGLDYMFDFRFFFTLHVTDTSQDGLMIFAGQQAANPKYGADFFAVGLKEGHLYFHYNLGSGPALLRSSLPVDTSRSVHQVAFGRDRRNGYLSVDGQANATGTSGGTLLGLNIFSNLYVGGFDNYDVTLPSDVMFKDGFKGCLYAVELRTGTNGQWRSPGAVLTGRNVGQCQRAECTFSDCRNGATCIDLGATHRCECMVGFKGPTCADVTTPCDGVHNCGEGATCLPLVAGGYTCLCPLGKAGQRCDQDITISDARFVGEVSHMAFPHKGSLRFAIDVTMQFKPEVTSGLLLYIAEHLSRRSGDFLSVSLLDGRVQLRYRVGTAPTVVVTSEGPATVGGWHTLTSGRNTTHGYVTLNGRTTFVKVTGEMVGLDVTTPIYVAGIPDLGSMAPSGVEKEPSAYEGCLRQLVVNGHNYRLSERGAATGVNVIDCDGTACGHDVCQNGGTCYPRVNGGGYVCGCTKAYVGLQCETSVLCEDSPCAGGATCVPDIANRTYSCICPLGRRGDDCEKEVSFTDARFVGDSYIFYQDPAYNDSDVTKTYIAFNFSTVAYNGMIMWNGQAYSDKDDYLGVGVHRGRARVVVSLGWWTREDVVTDQVINDGEWHSLIIQRSDRQLRVYVDGTLYDVNLAGQFGGLNTGGGYYFGGFEFDKSMMAETCMHFDTAYMGCLRDVHLHADSAPLNLQQATAGANIQSCDPR